MEWPFRVMASRFSLLLLRELLLLTPSTFVTPPRLEKDRTLANLEPLLQILNSILIVAFKTSEHASPLEFRADLRKGCWHRGMTFQTLSRAVNIVH